MPKKSSQPKSAKSTTSTTSTTGDQHQQPQDGSVDTAQLEQQLSELTKKLTDQEEITKKAQSDYVRQKLEFDEYMTRSEAQKKTSKVESLVETVQKIIPVINQLKQMTDTIPDELTGNSRVQGVSLLYKKSLSDLATLGIAPIVTEIGADVDYTLHIPIGMEETDDETLKNKILKEIEPGYIYEKGDVKKVVSPVKVIVGS